MVSPPPSVMQREHRTAAARSQEYPVTQVVRWSGPPAVVRVKTPADVIVVLPTELAPSQALGLARLVLDHREYTQLCRTIEPLQAQGKTRPAQRARRCR